MGAIGAWKQPHFITASLLVTFLPPISAFVSLPLVRCCAPSSLVCCSLDVSDNSGAGAHLDKVFGGVAELDGHGSDPSRCFFGSDPFMIPESGTNGAGMGSLSDPFRRIVTVLWGPECGCGGTGRRTRFRFWRRKAWGFESLHPHHRFSRTWCRPEAIAKGAFYPLAPPHGPL